jgi:hypothetical protein
VRIEYVPNDGLLLLPKRFVCDEICVALRPWKRTRKYVSAPGNVKRVWIGEETELVESEYMPTKKEKKLQFLHGKQL